MGLFQTNKPKSAGKIMLSGKKDISEAVVETLDHMASMAGSTLGPGGRQVLIERQEMGMKPIMTKDGVTVIKNLGYVNSVKQLILESARDAALRTASEAGDGPQPLSSGILTPYGWITMGDALPGMEICGTNGSVQKIIDVFPKGEREIYEVHFSDGRVVECCEDHLWTVTVAEGARPVKTLTTKKMLEDFKTLKTDEQVAYKYYVQNSVVEMEDNTAEMPLDPYLLGLLLGDGSLSGNGSIELSLGFGKEHTINKIVLPEGFNLNVQKIDSKNSFRVKINGIDAKGNTIHRIVESLGLLGTTSKTKFIPASYLRSSVSTRKALLQGILDTDGYVNERGLFEFSTVSDCLAKDFKELAWSLGIPLCYRLHTREKDKNSYSDTPIHRIAQLKGYKDGHKIVDIRPTGIQTEMKCIKVSNDDHLYITDGFIPTHNTTTATILSAAISRYTHQASSQNPKMSPQRIVRELQDLVPYIKEKVARFSVTASHSNYSEILHSVASLSANGDSGLATSVMEAFDVVGEEGNLTIVEATGASRYEIEKINGYTVDQGYEESLKKFSNGFINDRSGTLIGMEHPVVLLYDGVVNDTMQVFDALQKLSDYWDKTKHPHKNILLIAHGFADVVLGDMHQNWNHPSTINVLPLITPQTAIRNWRTHFLYDLQSYTGSPVFNPLDKPIVDLDPEAMTEQNLVTAIECNRFRTSIISKEDPALIECRVEELKHQLKNPESQYEENDLNVRIGKLTSGIARLYVYGPSQGETREKRDRAEDAWMAIRGAIKHGACPGGGFVLVKIAADLLLMSEKMPIGPKKVATAILSQALLEPLDYLYTNYGYTEDEIEVMRAKLLASEDKTFDVGEQVWVDKHKLLDSIPAVTEAIENSVSIASLLGTLGGVISFDRNPDADAKEQVLDRNFRKTIGEN